MCVFGGVVTYFSVKALWKRLLENRNSKTDITRWFLSSGGAEWGVTCWNPTTSKKVTPHLRPFKGRVSPLLIISSRKHPFLFVEPSMVCTLTAVTDFRSSTAILTKAASVSPPMKSYKLLFPSVVSKIVRLGLYMDTSLHTSTYITINITNTNVAQGNQWIHLGFCDYHTFITSSFPLGIIVWPCFELCHKS